MGFVVAFSGTYLITVTGNFGFLAPVLARQSPAVMDAITDYPPVVGINGLAAIAFIGGLRPVRCCDDPDLGAAIGRVSCRRGRAGAPAWHRIGAANVDGTVAGRCPWGGESGDWSSLARFRL